MRILYALIMLSLAGCATSAPTAGCDSLRPSGVPCRRSAPVADARLLAQADSVLALDPADVSTAGLALVQRAHAERLSVVEARATTASRRSSGIVLYLVTVAALGIGATVLLTSTQ